MSNNRRRTVRGSAPVRFDPGRESINIEALAAYPDSSAYQTLRRRMNLATQKVEGQTVGFFNRNLQMTALVRRIPTQSIDDIIDGRPLRVARGQHQRMFQVHLDIKAGTSVNQLGKILRDSIVRGIDAGKKKNAGSHWQDDDDDIQNYDVVRFDDMFYTRAYRQHMSDNAPEFDYFEEFDELEDEELLSGNHQFQRCYLEGFGIRKLVLREYTCIYESFMIILYHHQYGKEPNVSMNDWREYVLVHFNAEEWEVQQMFFDQMIMQCIRFFQSKYQIAVGLFNAHRFQQEFKKIEQLEENGGSSYKYFLVYWSEHVFPATRERIPDIVKHQSKIVGRNSRQQYMFMLLPSFYNILYLEVQCFLYGCGDQYGYYLHQSIPDIDILDVVTAGFFLKAKNPYNVYKQIESIEEKKTLQAMEKEQLYEYIRQRMLSLRKKKADFDPEQLQKKLEIAKMRTGNYFYTPEEYNHYRQIIAYRDSFIDKIKDEEQWSKFEKELANSSNVYAEVLKRMSRFSQVGIAVIDIETYINNNKDSASLYNMVPFCISLVGKLQQHYLENVEVEINGVKQIKQQQKVRLSDFINQVFLGYHPKECVRKLINFLMDNNYCHVQGNYSVLDQTRPSTEQKQLFNYIFAHNGFGFDFRFLYEELHSNMREFHMVGDLTNTKHIRGNGLFFYDFSLIYRESLRVLGRTFFPDDKNLQKKDCDLVIDLDKEVLKGWFHECSVQCIRPKDHPKLKEIIEYCTQDSLVLYQIVVKFFKTAYTTPFGHGFLPKMFFHSLSSLAYSMFLTCYLKKPIYVNKHSLAIEKETKLGGCTGANSNYFGIGVFIDENSFYPAVMKNEMPVEYEEPIDNPFIEYETPIIINEDNYRDYIKAIDIYCVTFKFPEGTVLPTISQKTKDTLVMVLESDDYDKFTTFKDAKFIYIYGYSIIAAIQDIKGTEFRLFGTIKFLQGDFIFKQFIEDQYNLRLEAKRNKNSVADMFHKNIMNSAQGKLGQKSYENVRMGSLSFIRDTLSQLKMDPDNDCFSIKQILTNNVDLFELRWENMNDKNMATGNTVRIPSYIMSVARTQLMRVQNAIAKAYNDPNVIAYYDTDSVLTRFDITNPQVDLKVQRVFDMYLSIDKSQLKDELIRAIFFKLKKTIIQWIGNTIQATKEMEILQKLELQDVTQLHQDIKLPLLDELRLGACKIEKYVIRGIALGAKQYGVYYLDYDGKVNQWQMKVAVKLKGVRADARSMDILEKIQENITVDISNIADVDISKMPIQITKEMTKWSRLGAGTVITTMRKIVRPTLTKRRHDLVMGTSVPFKNLEEFQQHKDLYELQAAEMKSKFKTLEEKLFEDLSNHPNYIKMQEAVSVQNILRSAAKDYLKDSIAQLTESRKRYMMRLPKIKYNQLQDKVFQMFVDDVDVINTAAIYFPKLTMIAYQAVLNKRTKTKKGINDLQDGKMSIQQAARVVTYTLFIYYMMKHVKCYSDIPKNFEDVAVNLSQSIVGNLLLGTKNSSKKHCNNSVHVHKWNYSLVYAFEFLQAGVCIYKNQQQQEFLQNIQSADVAAPLDKRMKYSSLWMLLNNIHDSLIKMGSLQDINTDVIDTTVIEGQNLLAVDENLALKGKRFVQALLISRANEQEEIKEHKYDMIDHVFESDIIGNGLKVGTKRTSVQAGLEDFDQYFLPKTIRSQIRKRPEISIDEDFIEEMEEFNDSQYSQTEKKMASILFMSNVIEEQQNSVKGINIREIYQLLKDSYGVTTFSKEFLNGLFFFDIKPSAVQKAYKEDLMDVVLLFLFLYEGGRDSAVIMSALRQKIQQFTERKYLQQQFQSVCSIIFCRPEMFKGFSSQRLSSKTTALLKAIASLTIEFDSEQCPTNEAFYARLGAIINDRSKVPEVLQVLIQRIRESEKLQEVGKHLYNQIIRWRKPTKEMLHTLMKILLLNYDIQGDNQRDTELLYQQEQDRLDNISEIYDQYMEQEYRLLNAENNMQYQFKFLDEIMENDRYDLNTFGNDHNNDQSLEFMDDGFYKVQDYEELKIAKANVEEFNYSQFFQQITSRIREDDLEKDDFVDSQFGASEKSYRGNKFFELEAEEASQDEEEESLIINTKVRQ